MLRNILVTALLFGTINANAQQQPNGAPNLPKEKILPIDYHEIGAPMPKFKLVTLDTLAKEYEGRDLKKVNKKNVKKLGYASVTRVITDADIDNAGTLIMMMFNPTCGHCEDETEILKKNIGEFNNSRLFLVANPNMKTYLPDFVRNHKTRDFYPTMTVGLDSAEFIKEIFQYGSLPQINIYSRERKLLKSFNGEVPLDSLKMYMN